MLTLADVLEALTNTRLEGASLIISEASVDSRQVIPASMFFALADESVYEHSNIDDAFNHGAHLAVIQKDTAGKFPQVDLRSGKLPDGFTIPQLPFCVRVDDSLKALQTIAHYWRRQLDLRVIGITGSVGKSATKELAAEVLEQRYHTLKSPGNLSNEIGIPLSLLRLGAGHQRAVLEIGFNAPGEISFLCEMALPQVGVITNIGTVHAERAGSQEEIAKGKAELIQALPAAPEGIAILNYDDPWVRPMASMTKASIFYYGLDPAADLWADHIESQGLEGILFRMHYRNEVLHLRVPLIGRHSVHTALRAAAVGLVEGLSWAEIVFGLQSSHTQLRMVAVHTQQGALILDDTYNASPESTLAALNLLSEMEGRKVAVLGDMLELGQYEQIGHEMVGFRAAEVCDELIVVGERGPMIASAAYQTGFPRSSIQTFQTVLGSIPYLQAHLSEGDVVLIKGSHGLRMDRIVSALEVVE
ncbi:MAG: UDP-N-acetylmuramoyl-tripeptide--D-alanyl-D-alanine ligase [Anaerolineaceae bacterium]|nr:UDP-N-acetylmuramoyl-tripeptide--D-alanyl-D-alanine ligase [Anaerolineaceae bacterium]